MVGWAVKWAGEGAVAHLGNISDLIFNTCTLGKGFEIVIDMLGQEKIVGHLVDALGALITTIRRERQTARGLVGLVQKYRTQNISMSKAP